MKEPPVIFWFTLGQMVGMFSREDIREYLLNEGLPPSVLDRLPGYLKEVAAIAYNQPEKASEE